MECIGDCCFLILAGGKSRRMGSCKAELKIGGSTFLEYLVDKAKKMGFGEIFVSGYEKKIPGTVWIPDVLEDRGPLGGIYSCFRATHLCYCFVVGVDMPLIQEDTVRELLKTHRRKRPGATLLTHNGKTEPLAGIYDTRYSETLYDIISQGAAPVYRYLDAVGVETMKMNQPEESIMNFNTPEEYRKLEDILDREGRLGMEAKTLYRKIPKIDKLLEESKIREMEEHWGHYLTVDAARRCVEEIRSAAQEGNEQEVEARIESIASTMEGYLEEYDRLRMQPVINATGVILHTNLGRAPLSKEMVGAINGIMTGYSNLEYNLKSGHRGSRYEHFADNICRLTNGEAALAVNNNAGAVLLMLSALTCGREAVVSRGELVEIGGKFRIPQVMEQSGTRLVEVGTTNCTYVGDYEGAVTQDTAAFLKVSTSNYKIQGYTREASIEELVEAGNRHGIPVLQDLGSGSFVDLKKYGLPGGSSVADSLEKGVDLVCFSADKLLGGPQAGILVGKKEIIDKIAVHPLMRALRIDKFTAAALDAVLDCYLRESDCTAKIPVLEMLSRPLNRLREDAIRLQEALTIHENVLVKTRIRESSARLGGGTMPEERLPSISLELQPLRISVRRLEENLRLGKLPVIARIEEDCIVLDMRTIGSEEIHNLMEVLPKVLLC